MDIVLDRTKDNEYFTQDFSEMGKLLIRIRKSFVSDTQVRNLTYVYITLFQPKLTPIRWGACRKTFDETLARVISQIKNNKTYSLFDVQDSARCRIMLEYVTEQVPTRLENINLDSFKNARFEPGITGLKLNYEGNNYIYMPTDAWVNSQMDLKSALNSVIRKTSIKNITNKISERISILRKSDYLCYLIKSRAFISYNDEVLPLYRGNVLKEYSPELIKEIALHGADWIVKHQKSDGRYLYYYDAKEDNYVDHEHPKRSLKDLYYNDLRHCGGIITLLRAYQLTKKQKYLKSAQKGIDFITKITQEHEVNGETAAYVFYNKKAKLGGTGMILIAMMRYRMESGDKSYDEYIKKYVRHLLSRIDSSGEMYGYYIHPSYNNGEPLLNLSEKERRETFSFYYPGEALLGLALYANHFNEDDDELKEKVLEKSAIALNWIVNKRPKIYADLFTELPSDAWLMQAIEEWISISKFQQDDYIDFVLNDANTMINKMYVKENSPYLDYDGGFYYNYGDHFYADGSRSEGLIAGYYLAKKLGYGSAANKFLEACRQNAGSQLVLVNDNQNVYAHKNPKKSVGAIRFKATRQWVRVDSIQHVACFYFRLYSAEKKLNLNL